MEPNFSNWNWKSVERELITERSKAEQKDWLPLRSCWHFSTNYLLFSIAGSLQCHARAWRPGRYSPARALGPGADIWPGDPFCWQALKEVQEAKEGGGGSSPATHCEARGRNSTGAHRCLELVHQGNLIAKCILFQVHFCSSSSSGGGRDPKQARGVRFEDLGSEPHWGWHRCNGDEGLLRILLGIIQKIADKEKLTGSTIWQRQAIVTYFVRVGQEFV